MSTHELLELTDRGLFCPGGNFYIDPWKPVERAVITHGHGDHARVGASHYLCAERSREILRIRLGETASIQCQPWGEALRVGDVDVSFHPAGHILGSAQIRVEQRGQVVVVGGDFKVAPDSTCDPFESIRCHTFVSESTFGLPIYRWPADETIFCDINKWWASNQSLGVTSVIYAYALGKAQRVLAGLDASIGPIATHGSVHRLNSAYSVAGVVLPESSLLSSENIGEIVGKGMVVAPPSVQNTPWLRKLAPYATSFASGWMLIRGQRRRRGVDRGFPLSDHADWDGLLSAITSTGASTIWVTHGSTGPFSQFLRERGLDARELKTEFHGDADEQGEEL